MAIDRYRLSAILFEIFFIWPMSVVVAILTAVVLVGIFVVSFPFIAYRMIKQRTRSV